MAASSQRVISPVVISTLALPARVAAELVRATRLTFLPASFVEPSLRVTLTTVNTRRNCMLSTLALPSATVNTAGMPTRRSIAGSKEVSDGRVCSVASTYLCTLSERPAFRSLGYQAVKVCSPSSTLVKVPVNVAVRPFPAVFFMLTGEP